MLKRQWRASSKPKSSLISLHRSCNQQDFHVIWDLKKKATFPACYFFRDAEMVTWKASMINYFIVAWSNAFTVLLGPDRPLPPWYLLTKRSIFASLHPHFRWSKLPISPGRIPFLLKSPFWRLKPLFIWLNHQFSGWTIPFSWWTYQKKIHFSWLTKWTISISDG